MLTCLKEPVNTDPVVSPKKTAPKDATKVRHTRRVSLGEAMNQTSSLPSTGGDSIIVPHDLESGVEVVDLHLDAIKAVPKTPAPYDLFSPTSTQPSEIRPEARDDTPPPTDLASRHAAEAAAGGRGSRRARANVSYAEPSLISKMRRPSKNLVDAVVSASRKSVNVQPESSASSTKEQSQRDEAKTRPSGPGKSLPAERGSLTMNESSRPEPQSPLGDRDGGVGQDRDQPPSRDHLRGSVAIREEKRTTSSAALSVLMNKSSTTQKSPVSIKAGGREPLEKALQKLDIYDVEDSPIPKDSGNHPSSRAQALSQARPSSASSNRSTTPTGGLALGQTHRSQSNPALARPRSRRQTLGGTGAAIDDKNPSATSRDARSVSARVGAAAEVKEERTLGRRRSTLV